MLRRREGSGIHHPCHLCGPTACACDLHTALSIGPHDDAGLRDRGGGTSVSSQPRRRQQQLLTPTRKPRLSDPSQGKERFHEQEKQEGAPHTFMLQRHEREQ